MIKKPYELDFSEKKLVMIIAGVAGIGKTTLALSAPKPLLLDLDGGVSRVDTKYRRDTAVVNTFEELKEDLTKNDLANYETIIIDTGGKLLEMLKPVVIKEDPKNAKRDGSLSLAGYGAIKRKFSSFINLCKGLNKHLILIFHATEVALSDDITGLRIRVEGSTRDDVWDDVDIGGFIEMKGQKRTIGFTNCERYYAKGTHGIHGIYEIPDLQVNARNEFITELFSRIQNELNEDVSKFKDYQEIMATYRPQVEACSTLGDVNQVYIDIKQARHSLTSKEELWNMLKVKARYLGLSYDNTAKIFIDSKSSQ